MIEKEPQPLLNNTDELPLSKELFSKDATVLKQLNSDAVTITSNKTDHGIRFEFRGFPYLGIWASPGADFVCIEPWQGIADSVTSNQQLTEKEGILSLNAGELFERTWKASFY